MPWAMNKMRKKRREINLQHRNKHHRYIALNPMRLIVYVAPLNTSHVYWEWMEPWRKFHLQFERRQCQNFQVTWGDLNISKVMKRKKTSRDRHRLIDSLVSIQLTNTIVCNDSTYDFSVLNNSTTTCVRVSWKNI